MHSSLLKPLFLVTEGQLDAPIICSLINTGERIVYMIVAGGYQNIASALRTQYLMYGDEYNYIAVFDSDSNDESVRMERISMVKYLSGADFHLSNIGVFCFRETLEKELGLPKLSKADKTLIIEVLKTRKSEMQKCKTIMEIQKFINQLR